MRKILFVVASLFATFFTAQAAITLGDDIKQALPSGEFVLPPPPAINSQEWLQDSIKYFAYKEPRLKNDEENWDSIWAALNEQYYFVLYLLDSVWECADRGEHIANITWVKNKTSGKYSTNCTRNTEDFPAMNDLQQLCEEMKEYHTGLWRTRMRPYYYFSDWYKGTKYKRENASNNASANKSYPSGHGYFTGLFGKCLHFIDPDNQEAIDNMMQEWLFCRLQLGAHWATDLPAGEQLGALAFDIAMDYDQFRNLLLAARQELIDYRVTQGIIPAAPQETSDIEDAETYIKNLKTQLQGEKTDFTIHRTMYKDGYFNTLCLPFSLNAAEIAASPLVGGEIVEFKSAVMDGETLELSFSPVTEMQAGVPYLIRWETGDNIISMTFHDVVISTSTGQSVGTDEVKFVGAIGQTGMTSGQKNQLFLGANNTFKWPKTGELKGFRAYFLVDENVAPKLSPAKLVIRPNLPTAVGQTNSNRQATKKIENGQLLILQNDVMYNAQGQIVR
ncbi:MAG: hypothetical protein J5884_02555 [Paludibacteraceae bacterium]|nr:hypothetical protein [Paludibacteraceae bacterium]